MTPTLSSKLFFVRRWLPSALVGAALLHSSLHGAEPPTDRQIQERRSQAYEQQKQRHWCDAQDHWNKLLSELPDRLQYAQYREEAQRNLQLLKPLCQPPREPVSAIRLEPKEEPERPQMVPAAELLKYYPPGRKVRSLMILNVGGRGVNKEWLIEGESHFAYQHRIIVESKVVTNTGSRLEVELFFAEAAQVRAVSRQEIQLRLPDSPILALLWKELEQNVLNNVPIYVTARKIADVALAVDPRGKRTLTHFAENLRRAGFPLNSSDEVEMLARIEKLQGTRLQVEYISGIGVTNIKVLDGQKFDEEDLLRIAYSLSLLLDYYIFPGAEKQPGEHWDVQAEDVVGLLGFGYDLEARGSLTLERDSDRTSPRGEQQAVLKLQSAEVHLQGKREHEGQEGTLQAKSGVVFYSPKDLLVREARITWKVVTTWFSKDHLLIGTEKIRDLKIESYYKADRIGAESP